MPQGGLLIRCESIFCNHSTVYPSTSSKGFPPPDPRVRDYLTGRDAESHVDYPSTSVRAASFLTALFQKTAEEIVKMGGELGGNTSMVTLASEFRKQMSVGQSVDQCNAFRTEFYDDIVNRARELTTDVGKYMRYGPCDYSSSNTTSGDEVGGSKKCFNDFPPKQTFHELEVSISDGIVFLSTTIIIFPY